MKNIKSVLIVGGGTAGWMAAAALSKFLSKHFIRITLIESAEIGTIGVGEATLPGLKDFNNALGIDELDFLQKTQATFKLGIQFNDWKELGHTLFHPFSDYGAPLKGIDFYRYWFHAHKHNPEKVAPLENYCLASKLAEHGKFALSNPQHASPLNRYHYAYHFDATGYAKYLRAYAEKLGTIRIEGKIENIKLSNDGAIDSVALTDGTSIEADLFIDCSGLQGLLIEGSLKTGFTDWSEWLPVNSAAAVQTESLHPPTPYTRTTALSAGWQWRIPLQHRVGTGYVYCDRYISDDAAIATLLKNTDAPALTTPRTIKFTTGKRKKFWNKNCVALGLASGFLEPLESTSIALIQSGISKLITFFPFTGANTTNINEANRQMDLEMERIRDFLIIHYKFSKRMDSPFWRDAQKIHYPERLENKINVFKNSGHFIHYESESFFTASWLSMYNGYGITPSMTDARSLSELTNETMETISGIENQIKNAVHAACTHQEFLIRNKIVTPTN